MTTAGSVPLLERWRWLPAVLVLCAALPMLAPTFPPLIDLPAHLSRHHVGDAIDRVPELARYYPSVGGTDRGDPWPAFQNTLTAHHQRLLGLLEHPVQTNEISRCSALLSGFLLVARETGLPLRLLEAGSSAGLLLRSRTAR